MASGRFPPSMAAAMAAATGLPGRLPLRSPTSCTVVTPYSPRVAAAWSVPSPQVKASTVPASSRARVASSREVVMGTPSAFSARTQMVPTDIRFAPTRRLDDLELLEEVDHALVSVPFVDDDLAGAARLGVGHVGDLLAGAAGADLPGLDPEVGDRQRLDG